MRLLLVDDDEGLRALLRATFETVDAELEEAASAEQAARSIEERAPDIVVLDVHLPGMDGLELCRRLKADERTADLPVVLLTGSDSSGDNGADSGADAYLRKPFSPLELLAVVERLAGVRHGIQFVPADRAPEEQLILYARDLRHLVEIERAQRVLLQNAYRETVSALATALETKDTGTRAHSARVQRYAVELADAVAPALARDASIEYGFLLHDVGKIGIPDAVLQKPGPLTPEERRLMETHTVLGEQMLGGVAFLRGEGLRVVRSHHERWDGTGYPDRLKGDAIPLGARVFAVADALDAMTSDRPYRRARDWDDAAAEIVRCAGAQFDPDVVDAFRGRTDALREIAVGVA